MIQVNATYKPGDRPESLIRNSGGLSAKMTVQAPVISRFLRPLLCNSTMMRGRRKENIHAKTYFRLIITHGF